MALPQDMQAMLEAIGEMIREEVQNAVTRNGTPPSVEEDITGENDVISTLTRKMEEL